MENETRNSKTLASFTKYCQENPEQRFWQALRNWSGYPYILAQEKDATVDTFYWEGERGYKK